MRRLLCVSLLLGATCAKAAQIDELFPCKYDGVQQEMNACAVRDYKAADKALNRTYNNVMSNLPPTTRERLRQQQRAWLAKRDPQCRAEAEPSEGGSMWPLEFYGCLKSATEIRTKELAKWRVRQ